MGESISPIVLGQSAQGVARGGRLRAEDQDGQVDDQTTIYGTIDLFEKEEGVQEYYFKRWGEVLRRLGS